MATGKVKAKAKDNGVREYVWQHPKFKKSTNKEWLKDRSKYPSGFCTPHNPLSSQAHEGTKPFTSTGVPMKVCEFVDTCPCTCHESIDKMYAMMDMPRPPAEQTPEYSAMMERNRAQMQVMLDNLGRNVAILGSLSSAGDPIPHPVTKDTSTGTPAPATGTPAPTISAPSSVRFDPTPTGRRAKGQLEYDVLKVCASFASNVYEWEHCTPRMVADEIGKMYAIEPPSTGAINAVWDRWEKLGIASQAKKPSRFVGFVQGFDGSIQALETIKSRNKRQNKLSQADVKRGSLRPRGK